MFCTIVSHSLLQELPLQITTIHIVVMAKLSLCTYSAGNGPTLLQSARGSWVQWDIVVFRYSYCSKHVLLMVLCTWTKSLTFLCNFIWRSLHPMSTGSLKVDHGGRDISLWVTNWNQGLETVLSSLTWSTDVTQLVWSKYSNFHHVKGYLYMN